MGKQKILIRADGSTTIGYGHVHRMVSLVKILKDEFNCIFVSHEGPDFLLNELRSEGIPFIELERIVYKLPDLRGEKEEIPFDMDEILTGDEVVVIDGYWFGFHYQQSIKEKGSRLVCIDDQAETEFVSEAVINHSPGVRIDDYWGKSLTTSYFLGTQYSLVSVPIKCSQSKQRENVSSSLLIGMGGSDPSNFTCKLLHDYKKFISGFTEVVVLVGSNFKYLKELDKIKSGQHNIRIAKDLRKNDVYALMSSCGVAILSASTISLEYASIGGILGITQTAENQKFVYHGLLSNYAALTVDELVRSKGEQYERLIENQKMLFDGKSSGRLISIFKELEIRTKIKLISAAREHLEHTFKWATDPHIRMYAFNKNIISLDEHTNWFLKKIDDPNSVFLIGVLEGEIIGSIRFDVKKNVALISYLVDPNYQGQGLGRTLLAEGIKVLKRSDLSVIKIEGYIMPANIASVKVFEKMAFDKEVLPDCLLYYKFLNHNE